MFQMKPLSQEGVEAALEKAERYRLLNEPRPAESICLDVLELEPTNQRALVTLILARTDQFFREGGARVPDVRTLLGGLKGDYQQTYYAGIICERWAAAILRRGNPGCGPDAYQWLREAMDWYEKAEKLRPEGHDDPILRWNTCARRINNDCNLEPATRDDFHPLLE